jgi:hypothetical protein
MFNLKDDRSLWRPRAGKRVALDLYVMVYVRPHRIGAGRMSDVSRSGCFIETEMQVAPLSGVRVIFGRPGAQGPTLRGLDGQVRRTFGDGIGLEWTDELTAADVALMAATQEQEAAGCADGLLQVAGNFRRRSIHVNER